MHVQSECVNTRQKSQQEDTTTEATEQAFMLKSNLTQPFSPHEIHHAVQTIQPLGSEDDTNELQKSVLHQHPSSERMSPSFIDDKLSSVPLTQEPAHNEQV